MSESRRTMRAIGLIGVFTVGVLLAIFGLGREPSPAREPATPSTSEKTLLVATPPSVTRVTKTPVVSVADASIKIGHSQQSTRNPAAPRIETSGTSVQTPTAPPPDPALRTGLLSPLHQSWVKRAENEPTVRAWRERHDELEKEPPDPLWGEPTEKEVFGYFSNAQSSSGVEMLGASCRTSACEIQAADAQASEHGARDGQAFLNGLLYQPWARADIEDLHLLMSQAEDGRTVYWAYLIRRQSDGAPPVAPPYPPTR